MSEKIVSLNWCVGVLRFLRVRASSLVKVFWLRLLGARVDWTVVFHGRFYFTGKYSNLRMGRHVSVNPGVFINASEEIWIGDHVTISAFSQIHTASLDICSRPPRSHLVRPVRIEDGVWVAAGAIVSSGVKIGRESVIGANSTVLGDVEERCLYAGNPARKVKSLAGAAEDGTGEESGQTQKGGA